VRAFVVLFPSYNQPRLSEAYAVVPRFARNMLSFGALLHPAFFVPFLPELPSYLKTENNVFRKKTAAQAAL
jgi:hypothetical protein